VRREQPRIRLFLVHVRGPSGMEKELVGLSAQLP
jgi:hypothetical protein